MQIALLTSTFSPAYGGLERYQYNLARQLVRQDCRVTVFTRQGTRDPADPWKVVPVPPRCTIPLHRHVHLAAAFRRRLRDTHYDCVLANLPYQPCDVHRAGGGVNAFWYPLKVRELGLHYWFSHQLPKYRSALKLERQVYNPANVGFQIANSNFVKTQIIRHYGFPAERIAVIANGIDFSFFNHNWCARQKSGLREKMGFARQDLVILCIANNFKRKGVVTLVKALDLTRSAGRHQLLVVGRGKPFTDHPRVRFLGHQQDIRPYYALADCLVLPTLYDPCANATLEAMACGLVPVTSPTNGASEFIQHGHNGFIMESWRDARGLARILDQLKARPADRREMAGHAADSVSHLTLARNADLVLKICRKAAQSQSSAAGFQGGKGPCRPGAPDANHQAKDTL